MPVPGLRVCVFANCLPVASSLLLSYVYVCVCTCMYVCVCICTYVYMCSYSKTSKWIFMNDHYQEFLRKNMRLSVLCASDNSHDYITCGPFLL
jgi:hypothetical protein